MVNTIKRLKLGYTIMVEIMREPIIMCMLDLRVCDNIRGHSKLLDTNFFFQYYSVFGFRCV